MNPAYVSSGGTSERIVLVFDTVDTGKAGASTAPKVNRRKTILAADWLADYRRKAPPDTQGGST